MNKLLWEALEFQFEDGMTVEERILGLAKEDALRNGEYPRRVRQPLVDELVKQGWLIESNIPRNNSASNMSYGLTATGLTRLQQLESERITRLQSLSRRKTDYGRL